MRDAARAGVLEADGLACQRGTRLLIEAVDWRLQPGDALLLKGPNGSGKSSLLRLLAGFLRPAAGSLSHDGHEVFADLPQWRALVHLVSYQEALKPGLSVCENLGFASALLAHRDRAAPTLAAALERFGLTALAATRARFLSTGQRRRVGPARLVAVERPIGLLDEPGTGLDPANRQPLDATIDEHRARGGIVIAASHGDVTLRDPHVLDLGD